MSKMNEELKRPHQPLVPVIAQDLIDLMFSVVFAYREHQDGYFKGKTREEVAAWVREKLASCGYPTVPMGISWGVLKDE